MIPKQMINEYVARYDMHAQDLPELRKGKPKGNRASGSFLRSRTEGVCPPWPLGRVAPPDPPI
eukprot:10430631-Alexandrium_andersonii.AAC.1